MNSNLRRIQKELAFISREARTIEGNYDAVQAILLSVQIALEAVTELEVEELPEVGEPEVVLAPVETSRAPKASDEVPFIAGVQMKGVEHVRGFVI